MTVISKAWRPYEKTMDALVKQGYFVDLIKFIIPEFINDVLEKQVVPIDINRYFLTYAKRKLPVPTEACKLKSWVYPGKQFRFYQYTIGLNSRKVDNAITVYKEWIMSKNLEFEEIDHDKKFSKFLESFLS